MGIGMKSIFLAFCLFFSAFECAFSGENHGWSVIGPAFSHHIGDDDAQREKHLVESGESCVAHSDGGKSCGSAMISVDRRKKWNEFHPAIGLEKELVNIPDWQSTAFAQIIVDSYGKVGVMSGVGLKYDLASNNLVLLRGGVVGGFWWRSVVNDGKFKRSNFGYIEALERRFVPFLLPVFEVAGRDSGVTIVFSMIPKARFKNFVVSSNTTLMMQLKSQF